MKKIKKVAGAIFAAIVLLYALTACGFDQNVPDIAESNPKQSQVDTPKEAQNDDQSGDFNKGQDTEVMPVITEDQPQYFTISPEQIYRMGEPVPGIDVQNGEVVADALVYTFQKATLFDNMDQAGITPDVELAQDLLDENGQLKPSVKFMLLECTVQNVRAEPERNISSLSILCAQNGDIPTEGGKTSFFEPFPCDPEWFSNPSGKKIGDSWKEYYNYKLPVGQSKNFKVGWLVDSAKYDPQNLYLTFDDDEYQKFVKVDF